jgi:hypothetical protein
MIGADDVRHWKFGPIVGFLVASVIMTTVVYSLAFNGYHDSITNCEQRNAQFAEVNRRAAAINSLRDSMIGYMEARLDGDRQKIAEGVPIVKRTIATLATVNAKPVTITDCGETFQKPFPFNLTE